MMRRNPGKLILAVSLVGALAAAGAFARQSNQAQPGQPTKSVQPAQSPQTKQASPSQPAPAPATASGAAAASKGQDAAAGAKPAAEFPPDKVVMKVGGDPVTVADLEYVIHLLSPQAQGQIASQGPKPFGDWYSMLMALSQKTAGQHLEDSPDFRRQMKLARMQFLAQAESKNIAEGAKVTPEEIKQYFATHESDYAALEVRQVSIRKKVPNGGNAAPGLPADQAKAKAEEIRKAIQSGTDFAKLADQFKMPGVIFIDPQPRTVRHGQLPADLEASLVKLKDGELSDTADNPQVVYFMQVVKHTQSDLKDVSDEIASKLKEQKTKEAMESVKKDAAIWMDPAYFAAPAPEPVPAEVKPPAPKPPAAATKPPASSKASQ
ncbi:MAG TPA: peptidyl-prolyl cis-trans isomerase [Terriglobia bacterium]|nr:peptidyl-prolyl cis-trans isomerase [Terriglobia bacterium]